MKCTARKSLNASKHIFPYLAFPFGNKNLALERNIYFLKIILIQTYKSVKTLGQELSCNESNALLQMTQ